MIVQTILIIWITFFTGYFQGSIFISYPWGLLKGIDITKDGTGQLGGSNAGRLLGWYVMPITGFFDLLKSYFFLVILDFIFNNSLQDIQQFDKQLGLIAGSIGLILGHDYSIYTRIYSHEWHGGKGTAVFAGILLFISWQGFLIDIVFLFFLLLAIKKILKTKLTIYDNFYTNAVQLFLSPFIIYFFVPESWIFTWLCILLFILLFNERKKVIEIIIQRFK